MHKRAMKTVLLAVLLSVATVCAAQDESPSLAALRAAAEQGQPDAQYELGILYEFGYNFADHDVEAYVWYSRAAAQGNAAAAKRRDIVKSQLSPAELQRAQAAAERPPAQPSR